MPPNGQEPTNPPTPPQSIPLRDLARPPDSADLGYGERRHARGRSLLSGGMRPASGSGYGTRYERLGETSPNPRVPPLTIPPSITDEEAGSPSSPVGNPADFQAAMGFAGLSVPDINLSQASSSRSTSHGSDNYGPAPSYSSHYGADLGESDASYLSPESDSVPLTDPSHLQPISGTRNSTSGRRPFDRASFQSIRFANSESRFTSNSRFGVEVRDSEAGLRPQGSRSRAQSYGVSLMPEGRARSRSPSSNGAFSRASSIVRAMSQRVVNLSGEAEFIEESARREAFSAHAAPFMAGIPEPYYDPETAYRPESLPPPIEKAPPVTLDAQPNNWQNQKASNPLKGNTLGIFSPENKIRNRLCDLLVYPATEPAILTLIVFQTVLLAVDASRSVYKHPRPSKWSHSFVDYALLALFVIFTLEIIIRSIVSGFLWNAAEYSSIDRKRGVKGAVADKYRAVFAPQRASTIKKPNGPADIPSLQPFAVIGRITAAASTVEEAQRLQLARRAFLRHSFNRLDLLAVISFWAAFVLELTGVQESAHLFVFQMLSCLRILRLLAVTSGTAIILRSLKKATPLLVNVSFLIGFFWLLFAIIGIQAFKGSYDRQCVWIDPNDKLNQSGTAFIDTFQFCGGQFNNDTGAHDPWVKSRSPDGNHVADLVPGANDAKGYLCPRGSFCLQLPSELLPYNGTLNFDNIAQSLELVFVVMTANTYSDLMYYSMNSDYLAAALFFAGAIVIMMLWLMNLLIAVITSSFQVIREEGKASAFAATQNDPPRIEEKRRPQRASTIKKLYDRTYWFWVLIIAYDLLCQAFRTAHMSRSRAHFINTSEVMVTFILLVEMFLRFATDWRGFHKSKRNWVDLGLAVITTVILLPPIRSSGQPYAWLTVFQILRVYRVVMAVKVTRMLILLVLGNASGIANLVLFVFLISFLLSIFAVQLFRGEIPTYDANGVTIRTTFFTIWNAFLGMYQVLSSENWTSIMYNITSFDDVRNTAWIGAIFFIGWFILANLILVNMFIAVIQENFDVSEDEKRMQQVKAFLNRKELGSTSSNLSLASIFKFGRSRARKDPLDYGPATMEMLLKDAVVKDFLDDETGPVSGSGGSGEGVAAEAPVVNPGMLSSAWGSFLSRVWNREPNPFYSNIKFSQQDESANARTMAKEAVSATSQRKKAQREYLTRHPNYNNSLFLFKPNNPIRKFCQRIVGPGRGSERFQGVEPNRTVWFTFSAFIYLAIVVMVLLACVTTPLYQRNYFKEHGPRLDTWFVLTDLAFSVVFSVEAAIKVLADGFFWTPNAYYRSTWGFIDGLVLITLWINVATSLTNDGAISRAVGAFKALRALRLLNISDSARNTFHSVILVGGWKILSAAFVSLSLLIPFAIYGVNLFNGQFNSCNDASGNITNLSDCAGEWASTPYSSQWNLTAPRVVSNPFYNFDNFGSSLFILFQIVSQEGWIDVMWSAQSIAGRGLQSQDFASQGNAIFFVVFNLLATVFVLTLFVSVFMRNYTEQTGVAFLTSEQRSWMELRKLLRQVSPSKRPTNHTHSEPVPKKWKDWCYKRATRKHGKWHRAMTLVLALHLILLLLEYYTEPEWWGNARDYIFLAFTFFYMTNVAVRITGLSWARFRRSSWDLFSIFSVAGTFISTILVLSDSGSQIFNQLHKLFLVSIVLLLIPRNDALDQLFKTAAASLTAISNLLATWFVLFLVFAIALTQTFGLTRFGVSQSNNLNFRTVPKALILLFRTSTGEGWNQIMEDYAHIVPPLCTVGDTFFDSDCGSMQWARALFVSWNILSMYIFTSLFVSLIYESFSYVYQRSSGLGKISREELRRFKQAWAALDPAGTGFISKDQFPRLLGELSGAFEMRIYSPEDSVRRILEDVQSEPMGGRIGSVVTPSAASGVDLNALNARVAKIDGRAVRRARARYNLFYEEVMVSADTDRGISFTTVLMVLAHYNVISDSKSLKLEEFLRRRARLQRVEEEVRRRIVVGFFDTMYWTRKFRKHLEKKKSGRMTAIPQLGPEVFVDDEDDITKNRLPVQSPPLLSPIGINDPRGTFIAHGLDGAMRTRRGTETSYGSSAPMSPASPRISPQLSPHRPSHSNHSFEGEEVDGAASGNSSRRGSAVSAEDVMDVLDNSVWGESIRRSFTMRRPNRIRSP